MKICENLYSNLVKFKLNCDTLQINSSTWWTNFNFISIAILLSTEALLTRIILIYKQKKRERNMTMSPLHMTCQWRDRGAEIVNTCKKNFFLFHYAKNKFCWQHFLPLKQKVCSRNVNMDVTIFAFFLLWYPQNPLNKAPLVRVDMKKLSHIAKLTIGKSPVRMQRGRHFCDGKAQNCKIYNNICVINQKWLYADQTISYELTWLSRCQWFCYILHPMHQLPPHH